MFVHTYVRSYSGPDHYYRKGYNTGNLWIDSCQYIEQRLPKGSLKNLVVLNFTHGLGKRFYRCHFPELTNQQMPLFAHTDLD
ncbi:MAG: hypothetical protein JXA20_01020 [Spirochaetes bacterium]|nr:hypothetical protein [Spirochaetota bacterium]